MILLAGVALLMREGWALLLTGGAPSVIGMALQAGLLAAAREVMGTGAAGSGAAGHGDGATAAALIVAAAVLIGAWVVSEWPLLLPWALGFAAGAMLFVISHEIIPESHRNGHERWATQGLMLGFALMMVLDTALG